MAGMALIAGGVWYMLAMPDHAQLNLIRAPLLLIMTALNFAVTLLVVAALGWGVVSALDHAAERVDVASGWRARLDHR